ncbi:MAG: LytTR family DNA-binding domain-containing protein [Bacteroidales bacterium]
MKKSESTRSLISVAIVDDEEHCIKSLEQYLSNDDRINIIATIKDPVSAIEQILEKKPDLLFLDIQMPGMTGFDILEVLNKTSVNPFVIFITAFEDYAVQAIRASAFDYLLKPVDKAELAVSVERAINKIYQEEFENNYSALLAHTSEKRIRFNTTGGFIMIDPKEIIFIQADWNYSEIHINKDRFEVVVINLGTIEKLLPKGDFARINRSVIINLKYLDKVIRGKRLCIMKKDDDTFTFRIPLRRIRDLEEKL